MNQGLCESNDTQILVVMQPVSPECVPGLPSLRPRASAPILVNHPSDVYVNHHDTKSNPSCHHKYSAHPQFSRMPFA